jgi:hypothetical protein
MSQIGRKTTVILDDDVYKLVIGYAVDNYGTIRAISRVINDAVRNQFSSERQSKLAQLLDELSSDVDRLSDAVNKLNSVLLGYISAINDIKTAAMGCRCSAIEPIEKLSSQLNQIAEIATVVNELRELINAIRNLSQDSVLIYRTHDKVNYIAGIIDRIKDVSITMNNVLKIAHNANRRLIKFEDVAASIMDVMSELIKSTVPDENTRNRLLNKLDQTKSEVLRSIEFD